MATLSNLQTGNTLTTIHAASLMFNPSDFNFYQTKPVYNALGRNMLSGCFYFINNGQYVTRNSVNINSGNPISAMTIELWVKADKNSVSVSNQTFFVIQQMHI